MQIKPLDKTDLDSVSELLPPGWDLVIPTLLSYIKLNFCFPIKVMIGEKIVGIGNTTIHNDTAWLSHIIVHSNYRNQNIGKFITKTLMEISNSKSCDTMYLLATDLGEPVYKKVGFITETEYVYFKGEKTLDTYFKNKNILNINSTFIKDISNLDLQVSGEDRMVLLEEHLSDGFAYLQENVVQGFYLPTLGDGLIVAISSLAGNELMKLRLTTQDFASFPVDNKVAIEFMDQNNFIAIRREKRMRFGNKKNWEPTNIYNRIGGNVG